MKAHIKDDAQVSVNKGNLTTGEKKKAFTRSEVKALVTERVSISGCENWISADFTTNVMFLTITDCTSENDHLYVRFFQTEDNLFGRRTHWIVDSIDRDNVEMLTNSVKDLEAITALLQSENIWFSDIVDA